MLRLEYIASSCLSGSVSSVETFLPKDYLITDIWVDVAEYEYVQRLHKE